MAEGFYIHPETPQARLVNRVVDVFKRQGVVVYPTDSCYAIGCSLNEISALQRIRQIRRLNEKHQFTLLCQDVSQVSNYAKVDNKSFRLMRKLTPGQYTFLLDSTNEVPRKLHQKSKRTIGIRIPDNAIVQAILAQLGVPIVSSTLQLPDDDFPMTDPFDIEDRLDRLVDAIVYGEHGSIEPTTIIDLTQGNAEVVRHGLGDTAMIE